MIRISLIILVFMATMFQSIAQTSNSTNCKKAYFEIMSLKFEDAEKFINAEKEVFPENPYISYLENYIDFLKVFISEDEEIFDQADNAKANRMEIIESISITSPYHNYLLANMNLQWAFARLKFGEYFSAAIEINRAYRLIEENTQMFPEFYPNKITHGVLKIIVGLVPEKYNWILNIVSMEGSVKDGTNELYEVLKISKSDTNFAYLKEESLFYLGFIELNVNPNKANSIKLLTEILPLSDSSLLFTYLSINILTKTGQNTQAAILFNRIENRDGYYPFHYLDYLHANFYLKSLDAENSKKYYSKFLKNFRGKNYIKDAWRKMAWAYLLEENNDGYRHILSNVATQGNADIGIDKEAQAEYDLGKIPNTDLLKARLLFDGFYFQEADSVLNLINESNLDFDQKLEKTYRRARIKHSENRITEAKEFYKNVVVNSELTTNYFPANSALKLGEIYESEDSTTMAYYYYKKCTEMNFHQFENSIKAKAKEGMRRVEE